jgi:hypothetical protein
MKWRPLARRKDLDQMRKNLAESGKEDSHFSLGGITFCTLAFK